MKILNTITSYPPAVGGAQLHTHEITKRLVPNDRVQVISHWRENRTDWLLGTTIAAPSPTPQYEVDGVSVQPISMTTGERCSLVPSVAGYYLWKSLAIDRISEALAPKILNHAKDVDIIINSRVGREGLSYASWKVARRLDVPFVFIPYHHPRWVGWNYKAYLNLYRHADAIIALTGAEKLVLTKLGVCSDRIFVTGIGPIVSPHAEAANVRRSYGLDGKPVVLFLGQKFRYKGVGVLLKAAAHVWRKFPEVHFAFVGPRTRFSRRIFARTRDPRIIEPGSVSLQEKTDWLAACNLVCVPSAQESFGGIYTEGWMMEKPVIGGDIPAIRDVISDGVDGYVVHQDPAVIAERITHLLEHPSLAAKMAKLGKQKVIQQYTWDRLAEKTRSVYQAAISGTSSDLARQAIPS